MKKIEILSPAGNMDALKAAVAGGCDAVYLGLNIFSARAFAGNFNHEEMIEAVRYCHERDVRVYVTMNTLLFENEIENAKKEIAFLYENDVDALLIQDLGLFHYVRTCYPDFDIHCSTQMHIHNLAGVKYMQKEGASRVVMARETPIEIIREACQTGMEIEVFVYGAICISYSGQCMMSASLKNRSANRGMCAQCCRLRYFAEKGRKLPEGEYLLSPKDLNIIDRIPFLIETGVSSLKIEGRMKRPEYVYLVTRTFREAIDAYYEGRPYEVSEQRQKELLLMFNRGFSHGHIFHDTVEQRMSHYRPNHQGVTIGTVTGFRQGKVEVKLSDDLNQHDGLRILNEPNDTGLTAVKIEKNGRLVNHAGKGDVVRLDCNSKPYPKKGQKLQKTSDALLLKKINDMISGEQKKIPVKIRYSAMQNRPFTVSISDGIGNIAEYVSESVCEPAVNAPLSKEKIETALKKMGNDPYAVVSIEGETDHVFMPVSSLNQARREAVEALNLIRQHRHIRKGMQPYAFTAEKKSGPDFRILVSSSEQINYKETAVLPHLPVVDENNDGNALISNAVISEVGDLWHDMDHVIAGMTLNCTNSYALAYLLSRPGIEAVIFSSEASNSQIRTSLEAFEKRYGFTPFVFKPVYGRRTLMYVKNGFMHGKDMKVLSDYHGNLFNLEYNKNVVSILEHTPYCDENQYCSGSYLILDTDTGDKSKILEEAYEEFYGRI